MEPIVQIKNIGKKYNIRHYQGGYIALRDVLMTILKSPFRFLKEKAKSISGIGTKEDFWALKDVSFDIMPGEVVGIIGRNGAGKSTLLKILTGITPPTTGQILMNGRVASLLEVGTGFHPELTGRENIFLNGAILGMRKKEVAKKFDEIVAFSGVEQFLDTPVKYYSSGMYVRLAFSVAAHMEPDILLVDEVLAVGDAEFQKKCLGKMEEVTKESGRTIFFVSHNMAAIQNLCKKCIWLEKGKVKMIGKTEDVINRYLSGADAQKAEVSWKKIGDSVAILHGARLIDKNHNAKSFITTNESIGVEINYEILEPGHTPLPNIHVFNSKGENVFVSVQKPTTEIISVGRHTSTVWIPAKLLNEGSHSVGIALSTMAPLKVHAHVPDALGFEVTMDIEDDSADLSARLPGTVRPRLVWESAK